MEKLDRLGRHIIIEYFGCDPKIIEDNQKIEELMKQAAIEAKATIVASTFHHFNPWGVSGAVIIQESHLSIHTWPQYGYASVDVYTCGDINPWAAFEFLEKAFGSNHAESTEIPRGVHEKIRLYAKKKIEGEITLK